MFFVKYLRVRVSGELHKSLKAAADKKGVSMAELARRILTEAVQEQGAQDGIDVISERIRKIVRNEIRKETDRVAGLTFKVGKAAATGMFLNYLVLKDQGIRDVRETFQSAQTKALTYMGEDEDWDSL